MNRHSVHVPIPTYGSTNSKIRRFTLDGIDEYRQDLNAHIWGPSPRQLAQFPAVNNAWDEVLKAYDNYMIVAKLSGVPK